MLSGQIGHCRVFKIYCECSESVVEFLIHREFVLNSPLTFISINAHLTCFPRDQLLIAQHKTFIIYKNTSIYDSKVPKIKFKSFPFIYRSPFNFPIHKHTDT